MTSAPVATTLSARASALLALEHARGDRLTAVLDLPAGPNRAALARDAVAVFVEAWGVATTRSRRWLTAADEVLAGPQPLELFVQLDKVSSLVTLELWRDGQVVFGIDDWVGF